MTMARSLHAQGACHGLERSSTQVRTLLCLVLLYFTARGCSGDVLRCAQQDVAGLPVARPLRRDAEHAKHHRHQRTTTRLGDESKGQPGLPSRARLNHYWLSMQRARLTINHAMRPPLLHLTILLLHVVLEARQLFLCWLHNAVVAALLALRKSSHSWYRRSRTTCTSDTLR